MALFGSHKCGLSNEPSRDAASLLLSGINQGCPLSPVDFLRLEGCNALCHTMHNIAGQAKWKMAVFRPQQEEGKCICYIYIAGQFLAKQITSGLQLQSDCRVVLLAHLAPRFNLEETVFMQTLISQKSNDKTKFKEKETQRRSTLSCFDDLDI